MTHALPGERPIKIICLSYPFMLAGGIAMEIGGGRPDLDATSYVFRIGQLVGGSSLVVTTIAAIALLGSLAGMPFRQRIPIYAARMIALIGVVTGLALVTDAVSSVVLVG